MTIRSLPRFASLASRASLALASLALASLALASRAEAGPPGFAFLEVPAGARAAGMAGAYTALATGAEAAFWNPAGLAAFTGTDFSASHVESFLHLRHDQVSLAGRMFGGGLAASVRAMYSEPIPERDDLGNLVGTFGSHDLEFLVGYGRKLAGGASAGLTAQLVRERIAEASAMTWALGGGAAWDLPALAGARLSVSAQDLGPAARYTIDGQRGEPVGLPASLDAGLALTRGMGGWLHATGALEARAVRGRGPIGALGLELGSPVGAAVRMGLRAGDDVSRFGFGAGWDGGPLRVDYAFSPSRLDLEDTHRFSLGARF